MGSSIVKLSADYVIGHNGKEHIIFHPGVIVYQNDEILYVGNQYNLTYDISKEFGKAIISPGFIDLDADIDSDHALQDIIPIEKRKPFNQDVTRDYSTSFTDQDYKNRHYFSMVHLIKNGITTMLPISGETFYQWGMSKHECELMAETAKEIGVRMYLGPSFKSKKSINQEKNHILEKQSVEDAYHFVEEWIGKDDLIKPFINPCQIAITDLNILKETAHYARKKKIPYRIHACEAIREWNYTLAKYQKTTITLFNEHDMLYPQFIIPHCITATTHELEMLAENGVSVVSTPLADLNFATALFSFEKYQHYGINMTMGTDTQPGDMIRNMRAAWDLDRLCHRRKFFARYSDDGEMISLLKEEPEYPSLDANHFFEAATTNAAKALGRDDIGRLIKGAKADIIVIDLNTIMVGPIHDPIRTLLNACTGNQVSDVIINGQWLVKDGTYVNKSELDILNEAQYSYDRYLGLYSKYDIEKKKSDELFPTTYPMITK